MTARTRPDLDDTTVAAPGKLSEALETVEQARGFLYAFHQRSGRANIMLGEARERTPGHPRHEAGPRSVQLTLAPVVPEGVGVSADPTALPDPRTG